MFFISEALASDKLQEEFSAVPHELAAGGAAVGAAFRTAAAEGQTAEQDYSSN